MLRKLAKTGVAAALHWSGAERLLAARAGAKNAPIVIGYHRVVDDFRAHARRTLAPMLISARTFERHLDWLGRRFAFVTLADVAAWAEGARRFERPAVAITFDDGYADLYHHGFPVLARKGIPAAVFVVTDLVGTARLQNHDELHLLLSSMYAQSRGARRVLERLTGLALAAPVLDALRRAAADPARLAAALLETLSQAQIHQLARALRADAALSPLMREELRALSWDMLARMVRAGFTIGSHTRTHARLTRESWQSVVAETNGSRAAIEQKLNTRVEHFAYPGGDFNASVVRTVAAAGYRCAYTSCRHRDRAYPALTIPRWLLWERSCLDAFERFSPALMSCQLSGVFDFARPCKQAHAS
ncbi:MAG: polysaccharide deacetylase family protein [Sulfurifustis sp.]